MTRKINIILNKNDSKKKIKFEDDKLKKCVINVEISLFNEYCY